MLPFTRKFFLLVSDVAVLPVMMGFSSSAAESVLKFQFDCISGLSFYFDHDLANSTKIISFIGRCILRYCETYR